MDFKFFEKYNVEVMGSVNDDRTVNVSLFFPLFMKLLLPFNTLPQFFSKFFIECRLGKDFDMNNYNQLISNVMTDPRFKDLF